MTTRRLTVLAGAALMVLAAGGAYAAIPDADRAYHACVLNNVGLMRIIDPSLPPTNRMSGCTQLETEIEFNQLGQQGVKGDKGDPGSAGAPGAAGAPGEDGVSVTSALEPPGANCANGGSRFTTAGGDTFACNGADGTGGGGGSTTLSAELPTGLDRSLLWTLPNGVQVYGACSSGLVVVEFRGVKRIIGLQVQGEHTNVVHYTSTGLDGFKSDFSDPNSLLYLPVIVAPPVGTGSNENGPFVRIDVRGGGAGSPGTPCRFDAMVTP